MKDKNMLIWIIIGIVIIAVAVVFTIIGLNNKNDDKNISLNLTELNASISQKGGFSEMAMQDIDVELLASLYGIEDTEAVEEVIGKLPMMNVQASQYLIIKAKEGKVDYVKEKIEAYGRQYEEQWATYLPAQYDLVKARKIGVKGNYVYMVIAENADDIVSLIK